ncbi:hypothetical protein AVEN_193856-1 [Araneus ventricosus]|uniref:Uncharacterized protein n=1 Tax=Araneus ventricosus TaxID=182803 RepID=A0A4Y2I3W7_ARAVE|nr:hypothetical protein AVEN_193856-1 [Araneus ventricosus]
MSCSATFSCKFRCRAQAEMAWWEGRGSGPKSSSFKTRFQKIRHVYGWAWCGLNTTSRIKYPTAHMARKFGQREVDSSVVLVIRARFKIMRHVSN